MDLPLNILIIYGKDPNFKLIIDVRISDLIGGSVISQIFFVNNI